MSGRPRNKVYHYTQDGRFIKMFDCENDVKREYYPNTNRPLFVRQSSNRDGKVYHYNYETIQLPDDTIISKIRIGREGVRNFIKKSKSSFTNISDNEKVIEVYNLDNKVIATFKGLHVASKITNISASTIHHQVTRNSKHTQSDLIFKYK